MDIEAALGQSQQNATDQAMSVTSSEIAAAMEEVHQEMARISKSKNFSLYSFRLSLGQWQLTRRKQGSSKGLTS